MQQVEAKTVIATLERSDDSGHIFSFEEPEGDNKSWYEITIPHTQEIDKMVAEAAAFYGPGPTVLLDIPVDGESPNFRVRWAPPGFNCPSEEKLVGCLPRPPRDFNDLVQYAAYTVALRARMGGGESNFKRFYASPSPDNWRDPIQVDQFVYRIEERFRNNPEELELFKSIEESVLRSPSGQDDW